MTIKLLRGTVVSILSFGFFVFVMGVVWGEIKPSIIWFFVLSAAIVLGVLFAGMALYMRFMPDDQYTTQGYYGDDDDNLPPRKPTRGPEPTNDGPAVDTNFEKRDREMISRAIADLERKMGTGQKVRR